MADASLYYQPIAKSAEYAARINLRDGKIQ